VTSIVELHGIDKSFRRLPALKDAALRRARGEVHALLGGTAPA